MHAVKIKSSQSVIHAHNSYTFATGDLCFQTFSVVHWEPHFIADHLMQKRRYLFLANEVQNIFSGTKERSKVSLLIIYQSIY